MPDPHQLDARRLRLAVAQTTHRQDPYDRDAFRAAGRQIRELMRQARDADADVIQFCEATLCFPDKHALSRERGRLAEAEWGRYPWDALGAEISQIRATAGALRLWTVLGAQRRIGAGDDLASRPRTSLVVIDPRGEIVSCYDERALSRSKRDYLYAPGSEATVIEVNGLRIGLASGLEVLFPSLFSDYEADGVDCVLFSTAGTPDPAEGGSLASSARTHALQNQLWIGYAVPSDKAAYTPAGILAPGGMWVAQCRDQDVPDLAIADLTGRPDSPGRTWRRELLQSLAGPA